MKAVQGFTLRKLLGKHMILPEGTNVVNFNKMIVVNDSAAYLWENICNLESFDEKTLADLLVKAYGIDEERALADSSAIAAKWLEEGIVVAD